MFRRLKRTGRPESHMARRRISVSIFVVALSLAVLLSIGYVGAIAYPVGVRPARAAATWNIYPTISNQTGSTAANCPSGTAGSGCILSSNTRVVDGRWLTAPLPALANGASQAIHFNAPYFGKGADAHVTYSMPSGTKIDVHVSDQVSFGTGVPYTTCRSSASDFRCQTTVQNRSQSAYTTRVVFVPADQATVASNQRCAFNSLRGSSNCTATMQFGPVRSPTLVTVRTAIRAFAPRGGATLFAFRPGVRGSRRTLCAAVTGSRIRTCDNVKLNPGEEIAIDGAVTGGRTAYTGAAWAELVNVRPSP